MFFFTTEDTEYTEKHGGVGGSVFRFLIVVWEGEAPAEPKDDWVLVPELVLGGPGGEVGLVCVVFHHGGHGGTRRNAVGVVVFF